MRISDWSSDVCSSDLADQFVEAWKKESNIARKAPTYAARDEARANLTSMAKSIHRDPQLESLLDNRPAQLGLDAMRGKTLSQALQLSLGAGRGMRSDEICVGKGWVFTCRARRQPIL